MSRYGVRPSVCLSVCLSVPLQQRRSSFDTVRAQAAGLRKHGAAAWRSAANAGSVNKHKLVVCEIIS